MAKSVIPTVDLSPFLTDVDESGKKKAMDIIREACTEYGFFQVVNHGVPPGLMTQALELSKSFFGSPTDQKSKYRYTPQPGPPRPAGYHISDRYKKESWFMCAPETGCNVFPRDPPEFQEVMKELFTYFTQKGQLVENIINDCLGLPPNFLKEFNDKRSDDSMIFYQYSPGITNDNSIGTLGHKDSGSITFVLQDGVGGLEVEKNGEWIPVAPSQGALVVNIGDVIQVLSNEKFKSATHRVMSPQKGSRNSIAFFYTLNGDKWVEPLAQFTKVIGETPKYRGFLYKEQIELRHLQRNNQLEGSIDITRFAVTT